MNGNNPPAAIPQELIAQLKQRIEELEVELKHVENDYWLTSEENEQTTEKYFEILSHMEELVAQRTRELEKSNERLRLKNQELQDMLDASPQIIFYKDLSGRYMRANKAFAELLDVPTAEIVGRTAEQLNLEFEPEALKREKRVIDSGERSHKSNEVVHTVTGKKQLVIDRIPYYNINQQIVGIIGLALDETRIHKYEQANNMLELAANTDPLTKLLNRRGMYDKMNYEVVRSERSRSGFCVALADIDFFKKFNDRYGHDCGDFVLHSVARTMRAMLRKQDIVARWGGEEFLMLFPETTVEGGCIIIEKLRERIAQSKFSYKNDSFNVSVTIGLSGFNPLKGIEHCIKQADNALYKGKKEGRNRVVCACEDEIIIPELR